MKKILRSMLVVMVLCLVLTAFTGCELLEQLKSYFNPACEHSGGTASCTEKAICEKCGEAYGEVLGHVEVSIPGVVPTCTQPGKSEGKKCFACGIVLAAQEDLPAIGHKGGAATCEKLAECSECGESYGELAAHTPEKLDAKQATCTATGLTEGEKCSVCDAILKAQEVTAMLDHTPVTDAAVDATCKEQGKTEGSHCKDCGKVLVAQTPTELASHTYDDEYDATCNVCGYERNPACRHSNTQDIAAVKATCTTAGSTAGVKCLDCEEYLTKPTTIPATGHTEVVDEAVQATCSATGLTEGKHCSVCKEVLKSQETTNKLPHTEVIDQEKAPNCTETGLTEGKHCSVCKEVLVEQKTVNATGHSGGTATCTEKAVCVVCEQPYGDEPSHKWVDATCTESKTCSVCNITEGEALGHEWVEDSATSYHCSRCDLVKTILNQDNAGTPAQFVELINANPAGMFVLGSDLDWNGGSVNGIMNFAGVLDGQGHVIGNFVIAYNTADAEFASYVFASNSGIIKNIAFEYTMTKANGGNALIRRNSGIIENCLVKVHYSYSETAWTVSPLVETHADNGMISNCITVISGDEGKYNTGAGVGSIVSGIIGTATIKNSYSIHNGIVTSDLPYCAMDNTPVIEGYKGYETLEAFLADTTKTAFSADAGWSTSWSAAETEFSFGSLKIAAPELPTAINKTNAPTLNAFIDLINADPSADYVLEEDLDFGGEISGQVIKSFTGTLDGQGHVIKNFEIKFGLNAAADDYISVLFENNSGTIKNIAFDYTLGTANNTNVGLVMRNDGTIQNVFVNVQFKAYQWTSGAIAAINGGSGKIENCVTNLSTTLSDQASMNRLGSIAGVDYNGTISNCYSIVNGIHTIETPYIDTWNNGTYKNNKNYASFADFAAEVTSFSADAGWSEYWGISSAALTFGNCKIEAPATEPDSTPDPEPTATVLTMENAGTPADFAALLNATPDGDFVLGSDLDWAGADAVCVNAFTGTLDGQGYAIKNFALVLGAGDSAIADTQWNYMLFGSNAGTIKNVHFVTNISNNTAGNHRGSLIISNSGTVENCLVEYHLNNSIEVYRQYASIATFNEGGTIKNNVINVTAAEGASITENTVGAIAYYNRNGATANNNYVILNGLTDANGNAIPLIAYQWATASENNTYDSESTLAASATFTADAGWSEYWSIADGKVVFGSATADASDPAGSDIY